MIGGAAPFAGQVDGRDVLPLGLIGWGVCQWQSHTTIRIIDRGNAAACPGGLRDGASAWVLKEGQVEKRRYDDDTERYNEIHGAGNDSSEIFILALLRKLSSNGDDACSLRDCSSRGLWCARALERWTEREAVKGGGSGLE